MTQTNKLLNERAVYENMTVASSSAQSFTILTKDDGIPGSKFEKEPEEYTVEQLKRWLKCRGLKQSGKRGELLNRVRDCIASGEYFSHLGLFNFSVWRR